MYDIINSGKMSPEYSYFNYQASYLKNSRAIGVLWCVFSMCYAIINVVVFLQPQWLGDTEISKGTGYFGLWRHCRLLQDGQDLICQGRLDDFSSILSPSFKASTILIGLSVLIITLCICSFVLFFFLHSSTVFHICGWFQAFNGIFLLIGILIFPTGWDSSQIKEVCGNQATLYNPGDCSVRWSFILAIISVIDVFVLSILAFVLGSRYVKMLPDQYLPSNASIYKGETNNGYLADNLSRKSLTLQPVMLLDAEKYSDYSIKGSSRKINTMITPQHTNGYHPSNYSNNFQL